MERPRHPRHAVIAVTAVMLGALVAAGCAATPPAIRAVVAGDLLAGRPADESDVAYGPEPEQVLDIHRTTATDRRGTIVFVHGGGFTSGSKESLTAGTFGPVLAQLERGFDVVSVDYRLAPAHPFPAALDDVALAVSWVLAEGPAHDLDAGRIILFGHSAGGTLVEMVGTSPGLSTRFGTVPRVDRWVAASAFSEFSGIGMVADFPGAWGLTSTGSRVMAAPLSTIDRSDPPGYLVHGDLDGFVADWHSMFLSARARQVSAAVQFDHVRTGPVACRGHYAMCGADITALQAFLG